MRKKFDRYLSWTFVALWMILIFLLSSQTSSETASLSGRFVRRLAELLIPGFSGFTPAVQLAMVPDFQYIIRKMAHIFLYMVLGGLCMMSMFQYPMRMKIQAIIATSIGIVYAATDELHQFYVDGRGAKVMDVALDAVGVFVGVALVLVIYRILRNRKATRHVKIQ